MGRLHVVDAVDEALDTAGGFKWETAGGHKFTSYYTQVKHQQNEESGYVHYRASSLLMGAITRIVEHNPYYETAADFHRNWDVHGVFFENEVRDGAPHDPIVRQILTTIRLQAERDNIARMNAGLKALYDSTRESMQQCVIDKDAVGLQDAIRQAYKASQETRYPWSRKLRRLAEKYEQRLGHRVHSSPSDG